MDLYIATGPYYLFNILNLKLSENAAREGVLLVVDTFQGAQACARQFRDSRLFAMVDVLPRQDYLALDKMDEGFRGEPHYRNALRETLCMRFPALMRRKYARYAFAGRAYERMYSAGLIPALRFFQIDQVQRYRSQIIYFDSGLACRAKRFAWGKTRWQLLRERLGCVRIESCVQGRYYYSPDMVYLEQPYPKLTQSKPQRANAALCSAIRDVFRYSEESDPLRACDVLYLHGGYEIYPHLAAFVPQDLAAMQLIAAAVPEMRVKAHPVSAAALTGLPLLASQGPCYPFEVSCLFQDMDRKVLISGFSVSLLNPKFIFDQEPCVIFLYRMFHLSPQVFCNLTDAEFDQAMRLMMRYRDPRRVMTPETPQELLSCLQAAQKIIRE